MKTHERRFTHGGALSPVHVTLGDLVRREAKRLGGAWAQTAGECASRAEKMDGRHLLHGEELQLMFDEILRGN